MQNVAGVLKKKKRYGQIETDTCVPSQRETMQKMIWTPLLPRTTQEKKVKHQSSRLLGCIPEKEMNKKFLCKVCWKSIIFLAIFLRLTLVKVSAFLGFVKVQSKSFTPVAPIIFDNFLNLILYHFKTVDLQIARFITVVKGINRHDYWKYLEIA